jgi:hypothetical protein
MLHLLSFVPLKWLCWKDTTTYGEQRLDLMSKSLNVFSYNFIILLNVNVKFNSLPPIYFN